MTKEQINKRLDEINFERLGLEIKEFLTVKEMYRDIELCKEYNRLLKELDKA